MDNEMRQVRQVFEDNSKQFRYEALRELYFVPGGLNLTIEDKLFIVSGALNLEQMPLLKSPQEKLDYLKKLEDDYVSQELFRQLDDITDHT